MPSPPKDPSAAIIDAALDHLRQRGEGLPPGVDDERLEALAARIGMPIPDALRTLLRRSDGPGVGTQTMLSAGKSEHDWDIEGVLAMFPAWRARGWLPIAADCCGSYYVVPTRQEFGEGYPVIFVDHEDFDTPAYVVASSVDRFFRLFVEEEFREGKLPPGSIWPFEQWDPAMWNPGDAWPFNKVKVLKDDPDIVRFVAATLPWKA